MNSSSTEFCVAQLKVLADATRLSVVEALMNGPAFVGELAGRLGVEQSLLSHHLQVMREARLVTASRDGKSVRYELSPDVRVSAGGQAIDLGCCRLSFAT